MKLSLVIPCYNESKNIPLVISKLHNIVRKRDDVEIVLVDNGSTDDSKNVIEQELKKYNNENVFKVVTIDVNIGYGNGILKGLNSATNNVLAWTHADMQTDVEDVFHAFDLYKSSSNDKLFIKGKRKNRKLLEALFTFGMQIVTLLVLKIYLDDINAQPKLFSKTFFDRYLKKNAPLDFSLDLYALYQAKTHGYKIITIPVYFSKRLNGEAKGGSGSLNNRLKLIIETLVYILKLRKNIKY